MVRNMVEAARRANALSLLDSDRDAVLDMFIVLLRELGITAKELADYEERSIVEADEFFREVSGDGAEEKNKNSF